jgi:hypothetical protein
VAEWTTSTGQEEEMRRREARAAARERADQDARQQAEADALFAEADRWADLAGEPADFRQEITRERAARIMSQLGEPLMRDARARAPERVLEGSELDAEVDRLAKLYPEPEDPDAEPTAQDRLKASSGTAEATRQRESAAAAAQQMALLREYPGAEALAAVIAAGRELREARAVHAVTDANVYAAAARLQETGVAPDGLPRLLDAADAAPRAPEAWRLPDGTPHTDSFLAAQGWQAQGGVYVRQPQAEPEAG